MSLGSLIPVAVGGAQAAVSTANQLANIAAGFSPIQKILNPAAYYAKDIGSFEFDYIGEERVEAGTESTDHYVEDNTFVQDNVAVKPTILVMRGFAAETVFNKNSLLPVLTAITSALTPVTPYLGKYSPGAVAAMANAVSQTDQILQQLQQIQSLYGSIGKLTATLSAAGLLAPPKVQQAYNRLDALRTGGTTFAVVTPWATFGFGNAAGQIPHGPMVIDNLVMVAPEDTRGWADIIVRMKEIRVAPSLNQFSIDNARAPGASSNLNDGTVSANTAGTA